ncbi:hypothetical protein HY634_00565 [Candidatus Uhrbacteria bacterium]|nr:hypothetical protein [Candidatus Uhrbacteria bacterium]
MPNHRLPLFMHDDAVAEIIRSAIAAIPEGTRVYLVGGAVRNAFYYQIFRRRLPQRDYDLVCIGDWRSFVRNLRKQGFVWGKLRRARQVVLMYPKVARPRAHQPTDYVVLDTQLALNKTIRAELKKKINFSINGFAIPLQAVVQPTWQRRAIMLPCAYEDLKARRLRVLHGIHPTNLYACLRFMSQGFRPPSKQDVEQLLTSLTTIEEWRFDRNVRKVFNYVGGERRARQLVRRLGIRENIFDLKVLRRMRATQETV